MSVQLFMLAYAQAFQPQYHLTLKTFTPIYLLGGVAIVGPVASLCSKFSQSIYASSMKHVLPEIRPMQARQVSRKSQQAVESQDAAGDSSLSAIDLRRNED